MLGAKAGWGSCLGLTPGAEAGWGPGGVLTPGADLSLGVCSDSSPGYHSTLGYRSGRGSGSGSARSTCDLFHADACTGSWCGTRTEVECRPRIRVGRIAAK